MHSLNRNPKGYELFDSPELLGPRRIPGSDTGKEFHFFQGTSEGFFGFLFGEVCYFKVWMVRIVVNKGMAAEVRPKSGRNVGLVLAQFRQYLGFTAKIQV